MTWKSLNKTLRQLNENTSIWTIHWPNIFVFWFRNKFLQRKLRGEMAGNGFNLTSSAGYSTARQSYDADGIPHFTLTSCSFLVLRIRQKLIECSVFFEFQGKFPNGYLRTITFTRAKLHSLLPLFFLLLLKWVYDMPSLVYC